MTTTTATTSFTTSGTMGSSMHGPSSFSPYFGTGHSAEARVPVTTTSSYSGTIMSTTGPHSFEPVVVRPMHSPRDSEQYEPDQQQRYTSPYPMSPSYEMHSKQELETKPSLSSPQRSPLGPSPLPQMSPSTKQPQSPESEKSVNYEELRMKIAYKKFERDCIMGKCIFLLTF